MVRDVKPAREAIQRAVYEFGSIAHLARALGVTEAELSRWMEEPDEMPLAKFLAMIEVAAGRAGDR